MTKKTKSPSPRKKPSAPSLNNIGKSNDVVGVVLSFGADGGTAASQKQPINTANSIVSMDEGVVDVDRQQPPPSNEAPAGGCAAVATTITTDQHVAYKYNNIILDQQLQQQTGSQNTITGGVDSSYQHIVDTVGGQSQSIRQNASSNTQEVIAQEEEQQVQLKAGFILYQQKQSVDGSISGNEMHNTDDQHTSQHNLNKNADGGTSQYTTISQAGDSKRGSIMQKLVDLGHATPEAPEVLAIEQQQPSILAGENSIEDLVGTSQQQMQQPSVLDGGDQSIEEISNQVAVADLRQEQQSQETAEVPDESPMVQKELLNLIQDQGGSGRRSSQDKMVKTNQIEEEDDIFSETQIERNANNKNEVYCGEILTDDQTAKFEQSMDAPPVNNSSLMVEVDHHRPTLEVEIDAATPSRNHVGGLLHQTSPLRISQQTGSSKLRDSSLDEQQVDHNVDKIMHILCKVLISEVTSEVAAATAHQHVDPLVNQNKQSMPVAIDDRPYEEALSHSKDFVRGGGSCTNEINIPETAVAMGTMLNVNSLEETSKSLLTSQDEIASKMIMTQSYDQATKNNTTNRSQQKKQTLLNKKSSHTTREQQTVEQQQQSLESAAAINQLQNSRRSSQSSLQKIYGVLSQTQKEAIRQSMKAAKKQIIKKENVHRVGADYSGRKKFVSPYAIDQEKNVIQSKVQIVKSGDYQYRPTTTIGPLDVMAIEMKIKRERQYLLPEFQPIMSQQQRSPKWYHLAMMNKNAAEQQKRKYSLEPFQPKSTIQQVPNSRKCSDNGNTVAQLNQAIFFPRKIEQYQHIVNHRKMMIQRITDPVLKTQQKQRLSHRSSGTPLSIGGSRSRSRSPNQKKPRQISPPDSEEKNYNTFMTRPEPISLTINQTSNDEFTASRNCTADVLPLNTNGGFSSQEAISPMSLAIDDGNFPLNTTIDRNNSNCNYPQQQNSLKITPVRHVRALGGVGAGEQGTMISSATQRDTPVRPMTQDNYQGRKKYTMIQGRARIGGVTTTTHQKQGVTTRPKNSATNYSQTIQNSSSNHQQEYYLDSMVGALINTDEESSYYAAHQAKAVAGGHSGIYRQPKGASNHGYTKITSNPSILKHKIARFLKVTQASIKSSNLSYRTNMAHRQELVNNYLLGNICFFNSQKTTATSSQNYNNKHRSLTTQHQQSHQYRPRPVPVAHLPNNHQQYQHMQQRSSSRRRTRKYSTHQKYTTINKWRGTEAVCSESLGGVNTANNTNIDLSGSKQMATTIENSPSRSSPQPAQRSKNNSYSSRQEQILHTYLQSRPQQLQCHSHRKKSQNVAAQQFGVGAFSDRQQSLQQQQQQPVEFHPILRQSGNQRD